MKINHINGNITSAPNLLSDNVIFGLDATTGKVLRFNLAPTTSATTGQPNMAKQTGTLDPSFQLSNPPPVDPVAISLGRDVGPETDLATNTYPTTNDLVLLVSTGHEIYVYNPTTGAYIGQFAVPNFDATTLGSTDTLTVMGDAATGDVTSNQLQMIDVYQSLTAGTAQPPEQPLMPDGNPYPAPANYTPPGGFSLVGGLTGLAGSNQVYPTVGAVFNSFQPNQNQLGLLTAATSTTETNPSGGLVLVRQFSTVSENAIQSGGSYVPVSPEQQPPPTGVGVPEGSVDSSLAINTIGTGTSRAIHQYHFACWAPFR